MRSGFNLDCIKNVVKQNVCIAYGFVILFGQLDETTLTANLSEVLGWFARKLSFCKQETNFLLEHV